MVGDIDGDRHPLAELDRVVVAHVDCYLEGVSSRLGGDGRSAQPERGREAGHASPDSKTPAAACHSNLYNDPGQQIVIREALTMRPVPAAEAGPLQVQR